MQKQLFSLILTALLLGAFSSIALAQETAQAKLADEEKTEAYRKYYEAPRTTPQQQKAVYDIATEFLKKYGAEEDQYVTAVKKWVAKYETLTRLLELDQAVKAKDYTKIITLGRPLLEKEPENFAIHFHVVNAGFFKARAGDKTVIPETIALARKTIQLLDSNKVTNPAPMASIDDARGFLTFGLAPLLQADAPAEAIAAYLRAAKEGGAYKTDPYTYFQLGALIYNSEYQPLAKEYSDKFTGKDETPESKAMLDKANAIGNRAIDAMARAVALATKPEHKDSRTTWMATLTDIYKDFHNNSDAGLNDLIATVLSKPLP